jgi:hypothetical protein
MNEHAIRQALEHLARGLSDGDLGRIAARWVMPALILSDAGATVVGDAGELERFFVRATEWYQSRGHVSTRAEVEHVDKPSERLAAVDVRWPAYDSAGVERSSECSHYIVQQSQDGDIQIRGALSRTR